MRRRGFANRATRVVVVMVVVMAVLVLVGGPPLVRIGHARWRLAPIEDYAMQVTIACFCPLRGTWDVVVEAGEGTATPIGDHPGFAPGFSPTITVDTLYDAALGRIDSPFPWARSPVNVDVDRRGVPWAGAIGTGFLDGTDSELDWIITSFEPRRPPSPAD